MSSSRALTRRNHCINQRRVGPKVEAGATLLQVQEAAREAGRLFPLSLAAEGSCTIGGNLATNAGGVQVLRYGNARALCLGLEVVIAHGELWNGLRGLRKDDTGYDLRDLFIGSEGTLGVITAATLKLFPLPVAQSAAFVSVPAPQAAVQLLQLAQARLGLAAHRLRANERRLHRTRREARRRGALAARRTLAVVRSARTRRSGERATRQRGHRVAAGSCARTGARHRRCRIAKLGAIPGNMGAAGGHFRVAGGRRQAIKHDISLPISRIGDFLQTTGAALELAFPGQRLMVFGHLGDGNLHYNLSPAADRLASLVHDAVARHSGSISAEHGLGVLRRDESARYKDAVELKLMRAVKVALDPNNLMDPGKVLP